jgi:hypothetical protein
MLNKGLSDKEICNNIGLEAEELVRLKHITGYSKLYEKGNYSMAKYSEKQITERLKYEQQEKGKNNGGN